VPGRKKVGSLKRDYGMDISDDVLLGRQAGQYIVGWSNL
jgi:hypothetical protein